MVYRQISTARVMRKIAIGEIETLYFQEKDGRKTLNEVKGRRWKVDEFKKYFFFELEE